MADNVLKDIDEKALENVQGGANLDFGQKLQNTVKIAGAVGTAAAQSVLGKEKVEVVQKILGNK